MEWPFSELFSANESLWNQYNFIAFYIFSGKILIIWYKILVATWNVIIFYRQELASLFQVQEKLKACRSSKLSFLSSCLVVNDSHEIVWLHVVVFSEHDILHFVIMSIYLNIIQWKYLKITLIFSVAQIKPVYKFSNFCLH